VILIIIDLKRKKMLRTKTNINNDFLEFNINTPKFITSTASSMITKSM
jgi:hypothetical protein